MDASIYHTDEAARAPDHGSSVSGRVLGIVGEDLSIFLVQPVTVYPPYDISPKYHFFTQVTYVH